MKLLPKMDIGQNLPGSAPWGATNNYWKWASPDARVSLEEARQKWAKKCLKEYSVSVIISGKASCVGGWSAGDAAPPLIFQQS